MREPVVGQRDRSPATSTDGASSTGNGRSARNGSPPVTCATCSYTPSRNSNASNSGWSASGTTIQYDATPNRSYTAFLVFRSNSAVLGDRTSTASSGGAVSVGPVRSLNEC